MHHQVIERGQIPRQLERTPVYERRVPARVRQVAVVDRIHVRVQVRAHVERGDRADDLARGRPTNRQDVTVEIPTGVAVFPKEIVTPVRRWMEKDFTDIRHWNELDRGGRHHVLVLDGVTNPANVGMILRTATAAGLDGVVAKPLKGTYTPDKRTMFKIKHQRTADCVVAGYRVHKSADDAVKCGMPRRS